MAKKRTVQELIGEAIIAMSLRRVKSHELQGMVTDYISRRYYTVNPETVQRKWRKMISDGSVEVEVSRSGVQNEYKIIRVGDIAIEHPRPVQGSMFPGGA